MIIANLAKVSRFAVLGGHCSKNGMKELNHLFEHIAARFALDNGERRLHLPSESHRALPVDWDAEAAFPIYETHQPTDGGEPFLLIVRTPRIVTAARCQTPKGGYDS
jgi:hypothetical protein